MQEDAPAEAAGYLDAFLRRDNVLNGSAREKAEALLKVGKKERAMQDVLSDAQKLVSQPPWVLLPEAMVQLLAAKRLTITLAEVQTFLTNLAKAATGAPMPVSVPRLAATVAPKKRLVLKKRAVAPPAAAPANEALAGERFELKQGPAHATAHLQSGGALLVLAGSVAAATAAASLSAGGAAARQKLLASGALKPHDGQLVFTVDSLFESANLAAVVLVARSVNAQMAWQRPSGRQVRDFLK